MRITPSTPAAAAQCAARPDQPGVVMRSRIRSSVGCGGSDRRGIGTTARMPGGVSTSLICVATASDANKGEIRPTSALSFHDSATNNSGRLHSRIQHISDPAVTFNDKSTLHARGSAYQLAAASYLTLLFVVLVIISRFPTSHATAAMHQINCQCRVIIVAFASCGHFPCING